MERKDIDQIKKRGWAGWIAAHFTENSCSPGRKDNGGCLDEGLESCYPSFLREFTGKRVEKKRILGKRKAIRVERKKHSGDSCEKR